MIKLHHGNCLEIMREIPDKSIDFILTDPPYGTTACKWDSVIPFDPMWKELKRIIKPNAAIALFGSEPFSSHLRMSNIKEFKYDWYWKKNKSSGFVQAKNKPLNYIEVISIFSSGIIGHKNQIKKQRMKYYPQGVNESRTILKDRKNQNSKSDHLYFRPSHQDVYKYQGEGYPKTLLEYKNPTAKDRYHPTQKPVALLEYLIKTYTLEGEAVLDFTMGSGSTGVAAKNLNRSFIGIEKDENYFEIAKNRIENNTKG